MVNTPADRAAGAALPLVACMLVLFAHAAARAQPQLAVDAPAPSSTATQATAPGEVAALPECRAGKVCWTAGDAEYRRGRVLAHHIVIYRAGSPLRIEANSAEGSSTEFDDSTWTLDGAVRVRTDQGQLLADKATLRFADSKLASALAGGAPATFEQLPAAGGAGSGTPGTGGDEGARLARGHARSIDYDPQAGEVRLVGEAFLSDGCYETGGERITYELAQQRVRAQGAGGSRVQGTIRPQCKPSRGGLGTP